MNNLVNIVTSDKGWILERLAREIASRISYVRYSDRISSKALITYYITYSCRKCQVTQLEMAYFAHVEPDPATTKKFFSVAEQVQHCVCHSELYNKILQEHGITHVTTINPGVDLDTFMPKLRIGVVGRTYHTGRKGEAIIAELLDIDWIDWHFTGEGWPKPALYIPNEEMPEFYRTMDYILVPSLYEGGPMCVAEALACGTEVIAPPVGWVPQFPHIEYKTGDANDLRRVLTALYQKKCDLRTNVENLTWDAWAEKHDRLFQELAKSVDKKILKISNFTPPITTPVAIILHGSEKKDKGGPSSRAPRTADLLSQDTNYMAKLCYSENFFPTQYDLIHVYNLCRLQTCKRCVEYAFKNMKPVVLSPIFLDLSEEYYFENIKNIFAQFYNDEDLKYRILCLSNKRDTAIASKQKYVELYPGYFDIIRSITDKSDYIIFLSEHEKRLFTEIGIKVSNWSIIHNPVDSELFINTSCDLFFQKYGVKDYVLCVARLETRKNQLMLAYALKDMNIPLVFIGHGSDKQYIELLHKYAPQNTLFIDRLEVNSPLLASAYAGAKVYCQPSWAEGASLSALEAAASGCTLVLSNRSSEHEYFGNYAHYCNPFSLESIRNEVIEAYNNPISILKKKEQQNFIAKKYSWNEHIKKTSSVYDEVLHSNKLNYKIHPVVVPGKKIYIDVTSSANRNGPPSGIARVEYYYAKKIFEQYSENVQLIVWNSSYRSFIPVNYDQLIDNSFKKLRNSEAPIRLLNQDSTRPYDNIDFQSGSLLLILGGAWITNSNYNNDVRATALTCKLNLCYFIHDIIQAKFAHWFPHGIGKQFTDNCKKVIKEADFLLVNSQCTANDVLEFSNIHNLPCPPIEKVRFGDNIQNPYELKDPELEPILNLIKSDPFILCVSALDIRKNHALLHNIWRKMIQEYGKVKTPHLICVGSKGWNIDTFLDSLTHDELVNNHIHIFHNIEDEILDWLYRRCIFTVYPSLYEGWGLPVAESLAYGKVCIAANAGSIPEICPEYTDLIDPLDFIGWYKTITQYIFVKECLKRREVQIKEYKIYSWETSSKNLFSILNKKYCADNNKFPCCFYNKNYNFVNLNNEITQFLAGGWGAVEDKGLWTVGTIASMVMRLWMENVPAKLLLECRCDMPLDQTLEIDININTIHTSYLHISSGKGQYEIIIPASNQEQCNFSDVQINFFIKNPYRPIDFKHGSTDKRLLGFFLSSIEIIKCNEEDILLEKIRQQIDKIVPTCGPIFIDILKTRQDLVQTFLTSQYAAEKILFWAWRFGCHENENLLIYKKNLFYALKRMHSTSYDKNDKNYTMLIHSLWLSRDDLHEFSPETREGRQKIKSWFIKYGINEYNLNEFLI